ncbi:hypothetical protein D9M71_717450 [compost metagenome]
MIVSIEKVHKDIRRHIGKSFLFFGKPTSIVSGPLDVFLNFKAAKHFLAGFCDPRIFENRGWKTSELDHYYIFYGLLEGDESYSFVRIFELGQIDRPPLTAYGLLNKLR